MPPGPLARPVAAVIYFHGGGHVGGERNTAGTRIYGNVASDFAQNGVIGMYAPRGLRADVLAWLRESGRAP